MAHVNEVEGYTEFAVATAIRIAEEESAKLEDEIYADVQVMLESWGDRLMERINARMDGLGIKQNLEILVSWEPEEMPVFRFKGETDTGVEDNE